MGSGTRLKILEGMSLGNPMVTTSIGIEGIAAEHAKQVLISDTADDFAESVIRLLSQEDLFHSVRNHALEYVTSTFDWQIIGENFATRLNTWYDETHRTLT